MKVTQETNQKMRFSELFLISNLFSLFRILIIPLLWYYISRPGESSGYIALAILIFAGISDGLDGYLARKRNQVSTMGLVLDPVADKILAASLVIMLIFFRGFPIWLAVLIIGRDLLILSAAAALLRGRKIVVPSTITGKYTFFFIVALLSCSVIRFDFGVAVLTFVTTVLIIASMVIYAGTYMKMKNERNVATFQDKKVFRIIRIGLTAVIMMGLLIKLFFQL